MVVRSGILLATLLVTGCGFRAGDYEPVLRVDEVAPSNWGQDLKACHADVSGAGVNRSGYGQAMDNCMVERGHAIDLSASAAKFAAQEAERKKREREKAEKLKGY